uniref:Uncharacterized protein n=1 Tax=Cannabis sativa TaxID=3483 RepID=A0A803QX76_CANSA
MNRLVALSSSKPGLRFSSSFLWRSEKNDDRCKIAEPVHEGEADRDSTTFELSELSDKNGTRSRFHCYRIQTRYKHLQIFLDTITTARLAQAAEKVR